MLEKGFFHGDAGTDWITSDLSPNPGSHIWLILADLVPAEL